MGSVAENEKSRRGARPNMSCPFGFKKAAAAENESSQNQAPQKRSDAAYRRAGTISTHLAGMQGFESDMHENTYDYTPRRISPRSFESIPGPREEDVEAYRGGNHWYINDL